MNMRRFTFIFLVAAFLLPTFFVYAFAPKNASAPTRPVALQAEATEETTDDDETTDGTSEDSETTSESTYYLSAYKYDASTAPAGYTGDWNADSLTITSDDSIAFDIQYSGSGNAALMWTVGDISAYKKLVLDLNEASDYAIELCIYGTGNYWDSDSIFLLQLAKGSTRAIITLDTLKYNSGSATGQSFKLTDERNMIVLRTSWFGSKGSQDIKIRSFYLTNASKSKYYSVDINDGYAISGATGITAENDSTALTFADNGTSNRWAWHIDAIEPYKYIAIVPAKTWCWHDSAVMNTGAVSYGEPEFLYVFTDIDGNNFGGWGTAYGNYQPRREMVYNIEDTLLYLNYVCEQKVESLLALTNPTSNDTIAASDTIGVGVYGSISNNKYGIDWGNLAQVSVFAATSGSTYEISAIYLTDDMPTYNNQWNTQAQQMRYKYRAYTASDNWGTMCLPRATAICGAYVYQPTGVDDTSNPTVLYLERVYGVLEAGKPYLFQNNTDKTNDLNEGYVTWIEVTSDSVGESSTNNGLVGNLGTSDITAGTSQYVLSGGVWYKGSNNTVGQYRAYLDLSQLGTASEEVKARSIAMTLSGETATAINEPSLFSKEEDDATLDFDADAAVYTLSGLRVTDASQPGIYIQNGKKFLVK